MASKNSSKGLISSIIFASVVISGSLVFFGMQFFKTGGVNSSDLKATVYDLIDQYITDKQTEADQKRAEENKPKFIGGEYSDNDAVTGKKDAPITIVEFSDYQCPYCASFYDGALKEIRKQYIETGKAKLVYRDFPLSFHPDAYPMALFAECVRDQSNDETYFKIHDYIFENQSSGFDFGKFSDFAVSLGADKTKLKSCFDNDKFKDEITKDQKDAEKAGIRGTPGFVINGWLVSGAQPFEVFQKVIEQELAKAK